MEERKDEKIKIEKLERCKLEQNDFSLSCLPILLSIPEDELWTLVNNESIQEKKLSIPKEIPNIELTGEELEGWLMKHMKGVTEQNSKQLCQALLEAQIIYTKKREKSSTFSFGEAHSKRKKKFLELYSLYNNANVTMDIEEAYSSSSIYNVQFSSFERQNFKFYEEIETLVGRNFYVYENIARKLKIFKVVPIEADQLYNIFYILVQAMLVSTNPYILKPKSVYQDQMNLYIEMATVMDFSDDPKRRGEKEITSLFSFLHKRGTFSDGQALHLTQQLINAIKSLHSIEIYSNNINIQNLFLTEKFDIKERRGGFVPPKFSKSQSLLINNFRNPLKSPINSPKLVTKKSMNIQGRKKIAHTASDTSLDENSIDSGEVENTDEKYEKRNDGSMGFLTFINEEDLPNPVLIDRDSEVITFGTERWTLQILLLDHIKAPDQLLQTQYNIYTPPEVVLHRNEQFIISEKFDMWSIGVCLFLLVQNYRAPFVISTLSSFSKLYPYFLPSLRLAGRPKILKSIRDLLTQLLAASPADRPNCTKLTERLKKIEDKDLELSLFKFNYYSLIFESINITTNPNLQVVPVGSIAPPISTNTSALEEPHHRFRLFKLGESSATSANIANSSTPIRQTHYLTTVSQNIINIETFYKFIQREAIYFSATSPSLSDSVNKIAFSGLDLRIFPSTIADLDYSSHFFNHFHHPLHHFAFIINFQHVEFQLEGSFGLEDTIKSFLRLWHIKGLRKFEKDNITLEKDGTLTVEHSFLPVIIVILNMNLFERFIRQNHEHPYVLEVFKNDLEKYYLKQYLKKLFFSQIPNFSNNTANPMDFCKLYTIDNDENNKFENVIISLDLPALQNPEPLQKKQSKRRKIIEKLKDTKSSKLQQFLRSKSKTINFPSFQITPKILEEMIPSLHSNSSITRINLSGNPLGDEGLSMLLSVLAVRKVKIQSLELSACGLSMDSAKALSKYLSTNPKLLHLDLSYNNLHDIGVINLIDALLYPNLRSLNLSYVGMRAPGGICIAQNLKYFRRLEALNIQGNNIPLHILNIFSFNLSRLFSYKLKYVLTNDIFGELFDLRMIFKKKSKKTVQKGKNDTLDSKVLFPLLLLNLENKVSNNQNSSVNLSNQFGSLRGSNSNLAFKLFDQNLEINLSHLQLSDLEFPKYAKKDDQEENEALDSDNKNAVDGDEKVPVKRVLKSSRETSITMEDINFYRQNIDNYQEALKEKDGKDGKDGEGEKIEEVLTQNQIKIIKLHSYFRKCKLLNLSYNNLTTVKNISLFLSLKILDLSSNRISSLKDFKGISRSIEELYLADNLLSNNVELTVTLKGLINLRILDLRSNKFALVPQIHGLDQLSELLLDNNCLLSPPVFRTNNGEVLHKKLTRVSLMGNPRLSTSIFYTFFSLSNDIQILNLSRCNLKYLSRSIGLCQSLIELNLSENELTILPPQLAGLFSLRVLNISNNHFKKLTSLRPVASLTLFSFLYDGNPVTPVLHTLLAENQIEENINNSKFHFLKIKEIIEGQVPKSTILNQVRISFVGPSMTGKSTIAKLLPYSMQLKKLKKQIQYVKNEISKVESSSSADEDVGDAVSDSSLEKDTEGEVSIHISKWNVDLKDFEIVAGNVHNKNKIRFQIWDFQGSESYFDSHSLFLRDRAIFVIFINLSISESKQRSAIIPWMDMITNSHPTTQIIMVGTHTDVIMNNFHQYKTADLTNSSDYIAHQSNVYVEYYSKRYPNFICAFISLNYSDAANIALLGEMIVNHTKTHCINTLKKIYPYNYIQLEKLLKIERKIMDFPYIRLDDFEQLVLGCGIEGSLQTITELLVSLGLGYNLQGGISINIQFFLHFILFINNKVAFRNQKYALGNIKIMPKKKGTLKALPTSTPVIHRGYFYHSDFSKVIRSVPEATADICIISFNSLEVLYTSPVFDEVKGPYSIVPSLLDAARPKELESIWISVDEFVQLKEGIQVERLYQFNSNPQFGFFSRLLVRLMHFTTPIFLWQTGIFAKRSTSYMLVEYFELGKEVSVKVRGKDPSKLLRLIVENIDLLLSGWYQNQPVILVPFTYQMHYQKSTEEQPIFTLEELEVAAAHGNRTIKSQGVEIEIESIAPDLLLADMTGIIINFEDLKIIKIIGEGGFGKVYTADYEGQIVAVKQVIVEEHLKVEVYREFRREVALCCELREPNIVQLIGVSLNPWCIILEYLPYGDLYSYLNNHNNVISWKARLTIAHNIASAIRFLHSFQPKIIHRDLKTPNCLVASTDPDDEILVKVTDFGESRAVATSYSGRDRLQNPIWLAPEIMKKDQYTEKADVFSFGIILWELLVRQKPFDEFEVAKSSFVSQLEDEIIGGLRPTIPIDCPIKYKELTEDCWSGDPKARPNFEEIYQRISALRASPLNFK